MSHPGAPTGRLGTSNGDGASEKTLRSATTRPTSRTSHRPSTTAGSSIPAGSAAGTSTAAGTRQPSSSSTVPRTGRLSTNSMQHAAGTLAGSNGTGSAVARLNNTTQSSATATAAGAATGDARQQLGSTAAQQQQLLTSGTGAAPVPPGAAAGTPMASAYVQSNALYGHDQSSMTPSVRSEKYTPLLTPDIEAAAAGITPTVAAAAGPAAGQYPTPINGSALLHRAQQLVFGGQAADKAQPAGHSRALAESQVPKSYLPTTGDLFHAEDQDRAKEDLVVNVCGAQLVSPAWNQSRPWLTGSWIMQYPTDYIAEAGGAGSALNPQFKPLQELSALSPAEQEAALVDDLLNVFMGQAGEYIVHEMVEGPKWQRLGLRVQGVQDPSLVEQVERLLPLCECVYVIKRFVETRSRIDHPMVAQGFAAAMRQLQQEWWLLVVQLEHQQLLGQLSLAGLVYYCQAPAASLQLLASIAGDAADQPMLTSAGLLNLLAARQKALAGDRPGQQLVGQLLEAAAEPYFGILRQWLCWGVLEDPYNEFMVKEEMDVDRDSLTPDGQPAYWTQRYRLRGAVTASAQAQARHQVDVPEFLASSKEAILVTGKYLNVIRQCGQPVPPCAESTLEKLRYTAAAVDSGSPPFLSGIQEALSAAAGALLGLMCGPGPQGRLLSWLHCLKHFFLMDQGDLLVHLMEQPELHEPPSALAPHQLQGLLDAALRSSSVAASPHIDVVGDGVLAAQMDRRSILQLVTAATCHDAQSDGSTSSTGIFPVTGRGSYASCLEMLLLTVKLSWPLTLVFSKRQLLHYQAIFKQLLSLKWAERNLGQLWQCMRSTKRLSREDQVRFRPWHLLCSQLLYVVGEVLRFTSIDVLEPLWWDMEAQLKNAANMDEVISLHNAFLYVALERSLLTHTHVVRHISVLLSSAHELAKEAAALLDSSGPRGSSVGRHNHQQQAQQPAVDSLRLMSLFCRDANRQAQLAQLQAKVEDALQQLVRDLNIHYQHLLTTAPAAAAAAGGTAAGGGAVLGGVAGRLAGLALDGGWGSGAAGVSAAGHRGSVGDSSRELASLHNLIQRLELGCHMGAAGGRQQAAWSAAY